ncbi:MAG: hypothetical protein PHU80_10540 [Kiritimatiellae bacterium]|nr:hypothetical protein [Kiritimatiellia bacterium]
MKAFTVLASILLCLAARCPAAPSEIAHPTSVKVSDVSEAIRQADKTRPRLFATPAQFRRVQEECRESDMVRAVLDRIIFDADQMLEFETCRYEKEGRRLLHVSRNALKRVSTLAMAFRMTGNNAYLKRCRAEMLAAAAFEDWNPSHFLDVAEMTLALAIGYDWLYHELDAETRLIVAGAILDKGLKTSLKHAGWWVRASNNWGQVCHAGMLAGALALMDQHPDLAAEITRRAIVNLPRSMQAVAPNGSSVPITVVRWGMVTAAKPDTKHPGTLLLRQKGKTLRLQSLHSADTVWQTYDVATPPNPWDSPNKGMVMIGFQSAAPSSGELDFEILFTPGFLPPQPKQAAP